MAGTKTVITRALAQRVLAVVDKGLIYGQDNGDPNPRTWEQINTSNMRPKPGYMCVEAAVCYAMGEPHSDEPSCVSTEVRVWKIAVNDECEWTTKSERARGMRRLAIAQLGSRGVVRKQSFEAALRAVAREGNYPSNWSGGTPLALGALNRKQRFALCEEIVQVLKRLKSPGAKFLSLAPLPRELRKKR